jgi:hypothetical protein
MATSAFSQTIVDAFRANEGKAAMFAGHVEKSAPRNLSVFRVRRL